ncbi:MAG: hypothetical protein LVR00_09170 [Rhabdochlamydiaceae bacterium]
MESFCHLLQIKPLDTSLDKDNFQLIHVNFKTLEDAERFRKFLPSAGASIEFFPSQLNLYSTETHSKVVTVQRRIPIHFNTDKIEHDFQFGTKKDDKGQLTALYRGLIQDRLIQLGTILGGTSENGLYAEASIRHPDKQETQDLLMTVAHNFVNFVKIFDENSSIAKRYFGTLTQIEETNKVGFVDNFIGALETLKTNLRSEKAAISQEKKRVGF